VTWWGHGAWVAGTGVPYLFGGEFYKCSTKLGRPRERPVHCINQLANTRRFSSFTDTVVNAACAIKERVFFHDVGGGVFERPGRSCQGIGCLAEPFKFFRRYVQPTVPVSLEVYPEMYYRGRRLCVYQKAREKVRERGVRKSDSFLGTFCKHEKIELTKKRAVPRVIQPRKPEYNVEVGRYIRPIEHKVYRMIAKLFGGPTVMKGYNATQVGEFIADAWQSFHDPVALGLDASRFDQHVGERLLSWEHSVYRLFFPGDNYLVRLLSWQLTNRGYCRCSDGKVTYQVRGGRCSGDMNTALGNCLIMSSAVWSLLHSIGLARVGHSRVRLFNNGDDCVLIGDRQVINRLTPLVVPFFRGLDIVMKLEPVVGILERLTFCQTSPVHDGCVWRMVRVPSVSVSKDATLLHVSPRLRNISELRSLVGPLADCGLALTSGLPVLQAYYTVMKRFAPNSLPTPEWLESSGMYQLSKGMRARVVAPTPMARASFYQAFGITPEAQVGIERALSLCDLTTYPWLGYGVSPSMTLAL